MNASSVERRRGVKNLILFSVDAISLNKAGLTNKIICLQDCYRLVL